MPVTCGYFGIRGLRGQAASGESTSLRNYDNSGRAGLLRGRARTHVIARRRDQVSLLPARSLARALVATATAMATATVVDWLLS